MIRDLTQDTAVLQSGYWRVQIDIARPHVVGLCADPQGCGSFCQEILEPGWGADSAIELADGFHSSRSSAGHTVAAEGDSRLHIRNIRINDLAVMDWMFELAGPERSVLKIGVRREILRSVDAVTDLVFGLHALREFAFWSRPSLRFGHDPVHDRREGYCLYEERRQRRVIGYHASAELNPFVVHGSPSYPDIAQRISGGHHHVEQHYTQHVTFGLSSMDFSGGPQPLEPGCGEWTIEFSPAPQGACAPVSFQSGHAGVDAFVPAFFDGYLLSSVACEHEHFGNNPYRHAYCPGAVDNLARGFLVTDRRSWSEPQGDIEARWRQHIRRTLKEGLRPDGSPMIMMDSGVWQDACGTVTGRMPAWSHETIFFNTCFLHLLKTGDAAFARDILPFAVPHLSRLLALDTDGDGLLENPIPGTPGSPASTYNDNLCIGHKDGYLNAIAHETLLRAASLLEWLDDPAMARKFRGAAGGIARAYNEQLWDEAAGHYLGWIDVQGGRHDAWYTLTNFPAVTSGLVPPERMRRMMQSFRAHPNHHRIFAAGVNLDPIPADDITHVCGRFGLWLNGGVLLGPASHELYARAVGGGAECAWEMLRDVVRQWEKDRLCATPLFDWCRPGWQEKVEPRQVYTGKNAFTWVDGPGATGAGTEPYLGDGGAILWALYNGMLGIRSDFQGLSFAPHLPQPLRDACVAVRLMGRRFECRYEGFGDRLCGLRVNGRAVDFNTPLPWSAVEEGCVLDILLAP